METKLPAFTDNITVQVQDPGKSINTLLELIKEFVHFLETRPARKINYVPEHQQLTIRNKSNGKVEFMESIVKIFVKIQRRPK